MYKGNLNKLMENYVRANRSAPIYDPYEEEETRKEDIGEADYVIEHVDRWKIRNYIKMWKRSRYKIKAKEIR